MFLTPVLVYTAWSRGEGEAPLLYGCLLLANAGSLLLPGSNLTNLIVLGHLHLRGGEFLAHMWPAWVASLVVTTAVVAYFERRSLRARVQDLAVPDSPVFGLGLAAVALAAVLVAVLKSPAIPVVVVGAVVIGIRLVRGKREPAGVLRVLGVPVLVGLFGLAVALGTLVRATCRRLPRPRRGRHFPRSWRAARGAWFGAVGWAVAAAVAAASAAGAASGPRLRV